MIDHKVLIRMIMTKPVGDEPTGHKIKRDAFLYLPGKDKDFAQCGTCWLFNAEKERCAILGPDFKVDDDDSCGLYTKGDYPKGLKLRKLVSPKNAGFVDRKVRCENCFYGDNGQCKLFKMLNEKLPDVFDLDTDITPKSCCNAQTPR